MITLLSIPIVWNLIFYFCALAKRLREAVFIELRIALCYFFDKILVKLDGGICTRVPISKRMGGAEKAIIFSTVLSECMDLVFSR